MVDTNLIERANNNNVIAMNQLAQIYREGNGTYIDYKKAFDLYNRVLDLDPNNAEALNGIASYYMSGRFVDKDIKKAYELYERAASFGNDKAIGNLAYYYKNDSSIDNEIAIDYYQKALEANIAQAICEFAIMYLNGDIVEKDVSKGIRLLEKALELGDSWAGRNLYYIYKNGESGQSVNLELSDSYAKKACVLGRSYELFDRAFELVLGEDYNGNQVEQDVNKALDYLLFASQYDKKALASIGDIYYDKFEDDEKALIYYDDAAKNGVYEGFCGIITCYEKTFGGYSDEQFFNYCKNLFMENPTNSEAGFQLALCYLEGVGVVKDVNIAVDYLEKVISLGHINALDVLAEILFDGDDNVVENKARAISLYELAADNGNDHAQTELGICYQDGNGVEIDSKKAIEYFKMAAEKSNSYALYCLAHTYYYGKGVDIDYQKAAEYFQKASNNGNACARAELGLMYEDGIGVLENKEKAFQLYYDAYHDENSYAYASALLGRCYMNGIGTEIDNDKAAEYLKIASDLDIAPAKHDLAILYDKGLGVDCDKEKSANLRFESFNNGNMLSGYQLALQYISGDGISQDLDKAYEILKTVNQNPIDGIDVPEMLCIIAKATINEGDINKAIKLFEFASEMNSQDAIFNLACIYYDGQGVPKQRNKALKYLEILASNGYGIAASYLGDMYYTGDGVPKNLQSAAKYYETAAKAGDIYSMNKIGSMYHLGQGVSEDVEKAEYWFLQVKTKATNKEYDILELSLRNLGFIYTYERKNKKEAFDIWTKLANQGNSYAQYQLAYCYANAFGVSYSRTEALFWVRMAINNGYNEPNAYQLMDNLERSLRNNPATYKEKTGKACYVATAVYGSYDCPQVWTLRRYRDIVLEKTWYGRMFIMLYYSISPKIIKVFGNRKWFNNFFRKRLDIMVEKLKINGFSDTPYDD